MKNLTKCDILNTFALKNNENLPIIIFEKLCPWFLALASRGSVLEKSVLGLEGCVLDSATDDMLAINKLYMTRSHLMQKLEKNFVQKFLKKIKIGFLP